MEQVITLSQDELNKVADQIQKHLNSYFFKEEEKKQYDIEIKIKTEGHYLISNKTDQEFLMMIPVTKKSKLPANQAGKVSNQVFLGIISINNLANALNKANSISQCVRIHEVHVDQGENTQVIGNLPSIQDNKQYREKLGKLQDMPIETQTLMKIEGQNQSKINDVQFSVLNPNYVLTLTSDNKFLVNNLADPEGLDHIEQTIDLATFIPDFTYGLKNKDLQFISFSQAKSSQAFGLQPFQILFITSSGHIYTLCPFYPFNIITTSDQFSILLEIINERKDEIAQVNDMSTKQRQMQTQRYENFVNLLMQGVEINNESQQIMNINLNPNLVESYNLQASLHGPLVIKNSSNNLAHQLQICNELPLAFLKVGLKSVQLVISFFQPQLHFVNDERPQENSRLPQFIQISEVMVGQDEMRVVLKKDPQDSLIYYLQTGQSLHKLDLFVLVTLSQKFLNEEDPISEDDLAGMDAKTLIQSLSNDFGEYDVQSNLIFKLSQNPKTSQLSFTITSLIYQNQTLINQLLDQQSAASHPHSTSLANSQPDFKVERIAWAPDSLPKFEYDKERCNKDQNYAFTVIAALQERIKNYASQYEGLDEIFQDKLDHLEQLKESFIEKAHEVQMNENQVENQKAILEQQLKIIGDKNVLIDQRMKDIKIKMHGISQLKNNQFVMQFFIKQLEEKAIQSQITIENCQERMKQVHEFDQQMRQLIGKVDHVDPNILRDIRAFVEQHKKYVSDLQHQLRSLEGQGV